MQMIDTTRPRFRRAFTEDPNPSSSSLSLHSPASPPHRPPRPPRNPARQSLSLEHAPQSFSIEHATQNDSDHRPSSSRSTVVRPHSTTATLVDDSSLRRRKSTGSNLPASPTMSSPSIATHHPPQHTHTLAQLLYPHMHPSTKPPSPHPYSPRPFSSRGLSLSQKQQPIPISIPIPIPIPIALTPPSHPSTTQKLQPPPKSKLHKSRNSTSTSRPLSLAIIMRPSPSLPAAQPPKESALSKGLGAFTRHKRALSFGSKPASVPPPLTTTKQAHDDVGKLHSPNANFQVGLLSSANGKLSGHQHAHVPKAITTKTKSHPQLRPSSSGLPALDRAPPSLPTPASTYAENYKTQHTTTQLAAVPPPLPTRSQSTQATTPASATTASIAPPPTQDPKFSTADRTILEELKRNINARAAQFVIKPARPVRASRAGGAGGVGGTDGGTGAGGQLSGMFSTPPGISAPSGALPSEHHAAHSPRVHFHPTTTTTTSKSISDATSMMGHGPGGIMTCGGGRHHPFSKEEVPYPRSYAREVVDLDVWETMFCQQLSASLTWHVFAEPPLRVLDVGCGTGTWILDCARAWKNSHFVGLDIVPLHPDLQQVGSSALAARITWVQANFLEGLPFPNDEFDFVHIKRIARGVPEDKWDSLLEEITRVMKPGGSFEMLEEDLFFPGQSRDWEDEDGAISDSGVPLSDPSDHTKPTIVMSPTPPRSNSPRMLDVGMPLTEERERQEPIRTFRFSAQQHQHHQQHQQLNAQPQHQYQPAPLPIQASRSSPLPGTTRQAPPPNLHLKPHPHTQFHMPTRPLSSSKFAESAVSLLSALSSPSEKRSARPTTASSGFPGSPMSSYFPSSPVLSHFGVGATPAGSPVVAAFPGTGNPTISPPFLLRTMQKPPTNPRDHSLLKMIYTEMHAARFINLSPLALLANALGQHFKDVRTHPPLMFTFPPTPKKHLERLRRDSSLGSRSGSDGLHSSSEGSSESEAAQDESTALRRSSSTKVYANAPSRREQHDQRWLSMEALIQGNSPYVTLDGARMSAFSPYSKASFPAPKGSPTGENGPSSQPSSPATPNAEKSNALMAASLLKSRVPNTTLNLDLRTLNLHLSMRVAEIVACSEAMWEWVLEFQEQEKEKAKKHGVTRGRSGSLPSPRQRQRAQSLSGAHTNPEDAMRKAIAEMTRAEFDCLLVRFALDMRDHMAIGSVLEDRFGWGLMSAPPTSERKAFDAACEKWAQWVEQELDEEHQPLIHTTPRQRPMSTIASTIPASPILDGSGDSDGANVRRRKSHDQSVAERNVLLKRNSSRKSVGGGVGAGSGAPRLWDIGATSVPTSPDRSALDVPPPTRRLSRAMRVFAAWKA